MEAISAVTVIITAIIEDLKSVVDFRVASRLQYCQIAKTIIIEKEGEVYWSFNCCCYCC